MGVSPKMQELLDSGLRIKYQDLPRPNEDSLSEDDDDGGLLRWRVVQRFGHENARVPDPPTVGDAGEAGGDLPANDAGD
jgi:hypothetical protein